MNWNYQKQLRKKKIYLVFSVFSLWFLVIINKISIFKKKKKVGEASSECISPMLLSMVSPLLWSIFRMTQEEFSVAIFFQAIFWHKSKAFGLKLKPSRLYQQWTCRKSTKQFWKKNCLSRTDQEGHTIEIMTHKKRAPQNPKTSRKDKWML